MGPPQGPRYAGYELYVYRFSDGCLYIGITSNPSRRHCHHRTVGLVGQKGLPWRMRTVGRRMRMIDAITAEKRLISLAQTKGRALLNKSAGGEIGGIARVGKYSFNEVLRAAENHSSLSEFRAACPAICQFMYSRGMSEQIRNLRGWSVSRPVRKWSFERCVEEAKRHRFVSDWKRQSPASYSVAQQRGWLPLIKKTLFPLTKKEAMANSVRTFEIGHCGEVYRVDASSPSKARSAVARQLKIENKPVIFVKMTTTVINKCFSQDPK